MLEQLPRTSEELVVIRCAVQFQFSKQMESLDLGSVDSDEFHALLHRNSSLLDPLDVQCDLPFRSRRASRYSNGTFGVLYASLDEQTAIAEITHWFRKWLHGERGMRDGYYTRFSVRFSGELIDISAMRNQYPSLTSDTHDELCKSIANAAKGMGIDAMIVPSARSNDHSGKNLVVFSRKSLGHPSDSRILKLTYNSEDDSIEYTWVPESFDPLDGRVD